MFQEIVELRQQLIEVYFIIYIYNNLKSLQARTKAPIVIEKSPRYERKGLDGNVASQTRYFFEYFEQLIASYRLLCFFIQLAI